MIRAGVLPAEQLTDCVTCQGEGSVAVERLFGRTAPEPYRWKTCSSCGGTGTVSAEWVGECLRCSSPFWRGEECEHTPDAPLCTSCAANCRECDDERRDR